MRKFGVLPTEQSQIHRDCEDAEEDADSTEETHHRDDMNQIRQNLDMATARAPMKHINEDHEVAQPAAGGPL